jgi:hypothetical protein
MVRRPGGEGVRRHLTGPAGGTSDLENSEQVDVEDVGELGSPRTEEEVVVAPQHGDRDDLRVGNGVEVTIAE